MNENKQCDVLVVGGGAAGLTAAAFCAKAGLSMILCERAPKVGGLIGSFSRNGFSFDAGIRALEDSGVIIPMLRSLGISIEFVKNPVTIGIQDRSVLLQSKQSVIEYTELLKSFFPQESTAIDKILSQIFHAMRYMDVLYGIENPLFLDRELKDPRYLTQTLLPWLMKYLVNIKKASRLSLPIRQYLMQFTANESLIDMICQHFFTDTPTFFALSYFGLYLDYRYPIRGTAVLPTQLSGYILAHGGNIQTDSEVVSVHSGEHIATLADGNEIEYRQFIWAADQVSLYRALKGSLPQPVLSKKDVVMRSHGIDSILTLFLGTNLPPEEAQARCGTHLFYTPDPVGLSALPSWQTLQYEGIEALKHWVVRYLEHTTYEISVPVLRDKSLAPSGKTGFIVSTLFDYDLAKQFNDAGEYPELKSLAEKTILRVLDATILPGLKDRVEFSLCSTPLTIERETGATHGAITGWAYTNHPMPAVHEFNKIQRSIETDVADVLQCGMWTFSPAGLPVSIMTGKLAADRAVNRITTKGGRR